MKIIGFSALSIVILCTACAPTGSQDGSVLAARSDQWEQALTGGDLDGLVALYTDDARLLPPNAELAQGAAAVREDFGGMIAEGLAVKLDTIEAKISGDIGYRVGTYALTAPDGSLVDRGKYIETWRLEGGEWKISNDTWNSDMPATGSGTTMIITHEVKDADHWFAAFQAPTNRRDLFIQNGVTSLRQFQSTDDPNQTGLLLEVADVDAFMAFAASPETANLKVEDGVKDAGFKTFTEVK